VASYHGEQHGYTTASATSDTPAQKRLHDALFALEAVGDSFAARCINDNAVRQQYRRSIQDAVAEIEADVNSGSVDVEAAAEHAVLLRNNLMDLSRSRSSEVGRAFAKSLKSEGKTFAELLEYRASKMFGKIPAALTAEERTAVMRAIISGAARDNVEVTNALRFLGGASRGLVALSVGLAIYDIYQAPDHEKETVHQGILAGAGLGGGYVVGALGVSLVCGPGAPICAGVFVLVGGAAFTLGADYWWHRLQGAE
jgi:hypothetical protein